MTGLTGNQIYRNFHEGSGPDALLGMASLLSEFSGTYGERAQRIRALMVRMESAWRGDAAGAAQRGAGPLVVEHELSSMALGTAQDLTNRQAGSFSEAKGRVVPVPPKPEMQNPMVVFSDPTALDSYEKQVDEYSAAAQNNVDVMNGYSGASEYNTTNLPTSYGRLSDDQAGIEIGTNGVGGSGSAVIDSAAFADDDDGGSGGAPGGSPAGGHRPSEYPPGWGAGQADPGGSGSGSPGTGSPGGGSGSTALPGITTPETFVPGASGPPVGPSEPGAGRGPSPSIGTQPPSVAAVPGGFGGSAPRGRFSGGSPGGTAGPRDGGVPGGPGAGLGAEPHGAAARSAPGAGPLAAAGRGGAAAGGFPMGGASRGRDEEDTEHKRPEWLEGGDPDELFDTDVLTAPPTIGAEDD